MRMDGLPLNEWTILLRGAMLGAGLAMDAFSVSLANGLREPAMRRSKALWIAGVFALFQTGMPLLGWLLVRTVIRAFRALEPMIPWIGFALLCWIGGKMLAEGLSRKEQERAEAEVGMGSLLVQGLATSIDALSAGLTMAELEVFPALLEAGVIGMVTFGICLAGVQIGRKAGDKLSDKASVLGGVILLAIGLRMLLSHLL